GQMAFDKPGTGGARKPLNAELDLAHPVAARAAVGDEILLHFGKIIMGEGRQLFRYQFSPGTGRCAVIVIAGETALHDGFGYGLTARAAHGLHYALYLEGIVAGGGNWLAAMNASLHGVLPRGMTSRAPR